MVDDITGLFAVVLSLAIPIVVMTFWGISRLRSSRDGARIREQLIQSGTDAETARAILEGMGEEDRPKRRSRGGVSWGVLTWGCVLLGGGIGVVAYKTICPLPQFDWNTMCICGALGVGLGLIVAFVIRWKLDKSWRNGVGAAGSKPESSADGNAEAE